MGNDGGSIPTRRELVKSSAAALSTTQVKEIQTEQQEHYWSTCALSHQRLCLPVVSDSLGTLYNKDAVIDHLLDVGKEGGEVDKGELEKRGEAFKDRLRGLKDVVEVLFHTEGAGGSQRWVCPVTGKPLGPGTRAAYLVPCGHAFGEAVFKEMSGDVCLIVCPDLLQNCSTVKKNIKKRADKRAVQRTLHNGKHPTHPPHLPDGQGATRTAHREAEIPRPDTLPEESPRRRQETEEDGRGLRSNRG